MISMDHIARYFDASSKLVGGCCVNCVDPLSNLDSTCRNHSCFQANTVDLFSKLIHMLFFVNLAWLPCFFKMFKLPNLQFRASFPLGLNKNGSDIHHSH